MIVGSPLAWRFLEDARDLRPLGESAGAAPRTRRRMPSGFRDVASAAGSVALALCPNHPMWTARRRRREVQFCAPNLSAAAAVSERDSHSRDKNFIRKKKFNCCMHDQAINQQKSLLLSHRTVPNEAGNLRAASELHLGRGRFLGPPLSGTPTSKTANTVRGSST